MKINIEKKFSKLTFNKLIHNTNIVKLKNVALYKIIKQSIDNLNINRPKFKIFCLLSFTFA